MRTSEHTNEIATALSLAQGEMTNAALSATNPHFKSTYSKLEDVWDACRLPLSKNNLAVIQFSEFDDLTGRVVITTRMEHKSGQWYESVLSLKSAQDTPHAFGSTITYGRRYSLMAIAGIAPGETDDDGNAGSGKKPVDTPKTSPVNTSKSNTDLDILSLHNPQQLELVKEEMIKYLDKFNLNIVDNTEHIKVVKEIRSNIFNDKPTLKTYKSLTKNAFDKYFEKDNHATENPEN